MCDNNMPETLRFQDTFVITPLGYPVAKQGSEGDGQSVSTHVLTPVTVPDHA